MLTRQHFKLMAEVIAENPDPKVRDIMIDMCTTIARRSNSRFNLVKFVDYIDEMVGKAAHVVTTR